HPTDGRQHRRADLHPERRPERALRPLLDPRPARTARGRRLSHTPTESSGSASSKEGPLTRRYPIHDERASPQSRLPAEGRPAVKKPERPAGEAGSAIWAGAEQDFLAAAAA